MLTYKGLLNKYDEPEKKIGPESPTRKRAIYPAEAAGRKAAEQSAVSPSGAAQGQSSAKNSSLTALSYGKTLPTVETAQRNRAQRAALPAAGTVNPSFGGVTLPTVETAQRNRAQRAALPAAGTVNPSFGGVTLPTVETAQRNRAQRAALPAAGTVNPSFGGVSLWQKQPAAPTAPVKINLEGGYQVQNTTVNPTWGLRQNDLTKSTAADEKTRLYETNDSLLSGQELLKKYNYVLQDAQMDKRTMERAAKKGMSAVGRAIKESPDMNTYRDVMRVQTGLQSKLKSAAFTAGLLDSIGGDGASILAGAGKKLALPALQEQNQAIQALFAQTKENNPTAALLGAGAGELSKAGAGYMTVGKWAEGGLKKGADALGKRMAASTASDASQRLAAWAALNPAIAKLLEGGTRLLAQQAADTAVNTPITLMAALAEGKSRGEIGRDIGRQMATDAAFNVGLEGMGMAARALTRLKGSIQTKAAMKRIPEQIEKSMTGQMKPNEYIKLGPTPPILQKYGMVDGDLLMPQGVVPKVDYPAGYRQALAKGTDISENQIKKIQGHDLGFEVIRQLPVRMKNPVAILKSDTQKDSLVVLTDMMDKFGQPIIVPIKVAKDGTTEIGNILPSMYGRKGFESFMEEQKKKGNILYMDADKKRIRNSSLSTGVQFPEPFNTDADPMLRIAQRAENVKGKMGAGKAIFSDPGSGAQMGKKIEAADASRDSSLSGPPLRKLPPADSTNIVADAAGNVKGRILSSNPDIAVEQGAKKNPQHFPGNGVQFPEPYSVTDPTARIAQQAGNVKGKMGKKTEAASAQRDSSLSSPPSSGNQLAASTDIITDAAGNVKGRILSSNPDIAVDTGKKEIRNSSLSTGVQFPESFNAAADPTARIAQRAENVNTAGIGRDHSHEEHRIQQTAQKMARQENLPMQRMRPEELEELRKEYDLLKSEEYRREQIQKLGTDAGVSAIGEKIRSLDRRVFELEDIFAQQAVLRTEEAVRADAAREMGSLFHFTDGEMPQKVSEALKRVIAEARSGQISTESRQSLFEILYKRRGQADTNADGLQELLRDRKLQVDVDAAADIADINSWNGRSKGRLGKIKIGRDSNVESFYRELSEKYPLYFPKGIDRASEQLMQMRRVSEMLAQDKTPGRADYERQFNRVLDKILDAGAIKQAYADELVQQAKDAPMDYYSKINNYADVSLDSVQSWYNELYRLEKMAERTPSDLNQKQQYILDGLLDGAISKEEAEEFAGADYGKIMQQHEIQAPIRALQERIGGWKRFTQAKNHALMDEIVGEVHIGKGGWKDKAALAYSRETAERNLRDIAPTKEKAEQIERAIFEPIHDNERKRMLFVRGLQKPIAELKIGTRKNISIALPGTMERRCSESMIVQWLGESQYKLRKMQASGASAAECKQLAEEIRSVEAALQPEQLSRIQKGISRLKATYKEMHTLINEILLRSGLDPIGYIDDYFPHMNFDDPEGPVERAAQLLGFHFAAKELPMDIAGRTDTFRPGRKWVGNFLHRTSEQTDYDALRAFDLYLDNVSDVIFHTEDVRRLRAYEDHFRFQGSDAGVKDRVAKIRADKTLDIEEQQKKIREIYEENEQNHKLQNYVNHISAYTDALAGKKSSLDRGMEKQLTGRRGYQVFKEIENRVAGNMVAGNIGSAMTNFIPITQAMGTVRPTSMMRGMAEALSYMRKDGMDKITKRSSFLATRENGDLLYKSTLRRLGDKVGLPMEIADKFSTQAVWRAKYYDYLSSGLDADEAIRQADRFSRGLFGGRSKGAMPTLFYAQSPLLKPFTMFQLEVNNQISYIAKDIPREAQGSLWKMARAYTGLVIGAYVYNDIYEKVTGRRSALDPFAIANEAVGGLTGTQMKNTVDIIADAAGGEGFGLTEEVEKKKPSEVIATATTDIGGNVPFVGGVLFDGGRIPVQSAFLNPIKVAGAAADMKSGEIPKEKGMQTISKEAQKPLWYLGMPFAGGQIRKTVAGLEAMRKGGSYEQTNKGEKLQFAVDQSNPATWAQAALFGKWATPEGQAYMNGSRALNEKSTQTYEKLLSAGVKNLVAAKSITQVTEQEKASGKRRAIRDCLLDTEQKGLLYYGLVASEKDREILDGVQKSNGSIGAAAECLMQLAECNNVSMERTKIRGASLPNGTKEYIYLNKVVSKDSREKEQKQIDRLKQAAVGIDDYLTIKNRMELIENGGGKSTAKADEMAEWIIEQGYTREQYQAISDVFAFWSMQKQEI